MEEPRNFGYITTEVLAKEFEAALKRRLCPFLVLFYADWCGHCQTYKPQWEKFVAMPNRKVHVAAVQDEQQKNVASLNDAQLQGYPTVVLIDKDGKKTTISSEDMRDEKAMATLLRDQDQPQDQEANPVRVILKGGARLFGPPVSQFIRSMTSKPLFSITARKKYRHHRKHTRRNPRPRKVKRKGLSI